MKKQILFLLIGAIAGFVIAFSLMFEKAVEVQADCQDEECINPPCCNGDVNGDAQVDIADAVYILQYLFSQGSEPLAIEIAATTCIVPATGQTVCYSHTGTNINCADGNYPGQDAFYQKGCRLENRFVVQNDGTVIDGCTGLMWQQSTAPGKYSWQEALHYCEDLILCNDGTWTTNEAEADDHGGVKHDDWRLPNVRELQSLVDYGRKNPAIDPVFETVSWWYLSSSTTISKPSWTWGVLFSLGVIDGGPKSEPLHVRAVRS